MKNSKDKNYKKGSKGEFPTREQVYRSSHSKFKKRRINNTNKGIAVFAILFITVVTVSVVYMIGGGEKHSEDIYKSLSANETAGKKEPDIQDFYRFEKIENSKVHSGYLILVNYMYEYAFPERDSCVNIYENKTDKYKVSYSTYELDSLVLNEFAEFSDEFYSVTKENCITINSAYRTYEEQRQIYDDYAVEYGEESARLYVANPGYSEHHTGYAMDLTLIYDDGSSLALKDYDNLEWINEHLIEHGFILRYPEEKYELTKINHEPWHYRYVSVPHSYIISGMDLCLEEYMDYIKNYTYDDKVICVNEDGVLEYTDYKDVPDVGYIIYYVKADDTDSVTNVPIPAGADEYDISGNNFDGFIVTSSSGTVNLSDGLKINNVSNQESVN